VLVVGVGGLGCPVALYLVSMGIGKITLVDGDKVDLSNLNRQILFSPKDIGKSKVEVAKRKLSLLNPEVKIKAVKERVNEANIIRIMGGCDIVVDGSDNFETKYLINDACVIANKPLVFGSIYQFQGQLSVLNFNGGPTYRC